MGIVVVTSFGADPVTITGPTLDAKVDGLATEFNGSIDNDNIKAAAGIAATKLATIATAGKVSGAALTLLPNIPSAAGAIPIANIPIITSAKGGSGADLSAAAQGAVPFFGSTGVMEALGVGTAGQVLKSGGAAADVSWVDYETALANYGATSTIAGFASYTAKSIFYKKIGKTVILYVNIAGPYNGTSVTFTVPYACHSSIGSETCFYTADNSNGTTTGGAAYIGAGSSTVYVTKTMAGAGADWTASGNRQVTGIFTYDID